ncbi:putative pyrroloquinoline-quinone binding quinoprotein [Pseudonocardia endophytica]|uniref:Putative pyrroloquinoline-quinone binding quinoprotein n=1 Tax=Pseudonocardia endophytica TaxID=401976 RepID=A0A4R1HZ53_PSEEN|nr:putative pyrroloquinoline-quinone binding quinoprotein [Pseudonocardia endophytica]
MLAGAALVVGLNSPAATTDSVTATTPSDPPPPATAIPPSFSELWRAPSPATPVPIAAGGGAVVAEGSRVSGRDARTGAERWSYTRELSLCTVAAAFGRVLADYRNDEYCSELSSLDATSGARGPARTLDARPGTRLVGDGPVVATGQDYLEAMRSDLVRTAEYGNVRALEEPDDQPRTGCTFSSFAVAPARAGVLETCPGDGSDRLTVLRPDASSGDKPAFDFSTVLGVSGARLIALSGERAAVLLPGRPRLLLLDRAGARVGEVPLSVGPAVQEPQDGVARTTRGGAALYWWTGAATVALDPETLVPRWTLPNALGPGVEYDGRLLVPVQGGLADVDPRTGAVARTLPVDRAGYVGPVQVVAQGEILLEQRGRDLVALGPAR